MTNEASNLLPGQRGPVSDETNWSRRTILGSLLLAVVTVVIAALASTSGLHGNSSTPLTAITLSSVRGGTVLLQGFDSLIVADKRPNDNILSLTWYCAPDSWETDASAGPTEGNGGAWHVSPDTKELVIHAPAQKDFWRKTFYSPTLIKDDGPAAVVSLDRTQWYTVSTSFTLTAVQQFDQAGLYLRIDSDHWLKTGIEVVDQMPRLSAVVTNVYSDWSTQAWPAYQKDDRDNVNATVAECHIRLHCRGDSFVVEARLSGNDEWFFVRIAHLSNGVVYPKDPVPDGTGFRGPSPPAGQLWAGVFSACPEDQQGSIAVFHDFSVVAGSAFEHTF